jgi:hypothetical protein
MQRRPRTARWRAPSISTPERRIIGRPHIEAVCLCMCMPGMPVRVRAVLSRAFGARFLRMSVSRQFTACQHVLLPRSPPAASAPAGAPGCDACAGYRLQRANAGPGLAALRATCRDSCSAPGSWLGPVQSRQTCDAASVDKRTHVRHGSDAVHGARAPATHPLSRTRVKLATARRSATQAAQAGQSA